MAFVTKEWKDRLVEFAGRRKLKNVTTGAETVFDVSRSEGAVSQAGDAFSAANMNNLEQRIKNEFDTVNGSLDTLKDKTTYQVRHQSLANTSVNLWDTWTDCELYKLYMPKTGICVMSGCISYLKSTPYPDGVVIGRCYNMTTTRASGIATETQITGCNFSALFYVTGGDMVPLYLRSGNQKGWVTLSDNEANNYVEYFVV